MRGVVPTVLTALGAAVAVAVVGVIDPAGGFAPPGQVPLAAAPAREDWTPFEALLSPEEARETLRQLPGDGYDRTAFGPGWRSVGNGCDVRDVVLNRDMADLDGARCEAASGIFRDPTTGREARVQTDDVQIDHVISLHQAWSVGAREWTPQRREDFANDLNNLMALPAEANRAKSDLALDDWLPQLRDQWGRCVTGLRWTTVATEYQLRTTARERAAARLALQACD